MKSALAVAIAFCTITTAPCAFAVDLKKVDGWKITQNCKVQGEEEIILCTFGLKIYNPKNDLTIIFTAPFKEVTYFDVHTGLMCKLPLEKADSPYQRAIAMISGMSLMDLPLHKGASSEIIGQHASQYATNNEFSSEQLKLSSKEIHSKRFKSATYGTFSNLSVGDAPCRFLARHYGLPYNKEVQGVPATLRFVSVSNSSTLYLETTGCKKIQISMKEFVVPPKLKMTTSTQAVLAGDDAMLMMY